MQDPVPSTHAPHDAVSLSTVNPPVSPQRPRRRWWPWLVVLGLVIVAVGAFFQRSTIGEATNPTPAAAAAGSRGVPVVTAVARSGNMGVYLTGLGTVTPLNTVTIHTRVDGELLEVDFKEGQIVQKGDLLARLDPRPFEVQLSSAQGQKAKDEANAEEHGARPHALSEPVRAQTDSKQQLDTQVATVKQARGAVNATRARSTPRQLNLVTRASPRRSPDASACA